MTRRISGRSLGFSASPSSKGGGRPRVGRHLLTGAGLWVPEEELGGAAPAHHRRQSEGPLLRRAIPAPSRVDHHHHAGRRLGRGALGGQSPWRRGDHARRAHAARVAARPGGVRWRRSWDHMVVEAPATTAACWAVDTGTPGARDLARWCWASAPPTRAPSRA